MGWSAVTAFLVSFSLGSDAGGAVVVVSLIKIKDLRMVLGEAPKTTRKGACPPKKEMGFG